jgi:hypothetical protein
MHTITTDRLTGVIEVTVSGFWTVSHVQSYREDLVRELREMARLGVDTKTLYNYTDAAIQSQEVVAAMKTLAADPDLANRRTAMYTEGMLARMQVGRVSALRPDMKVFTDRGSAMAWLLAPQEPGTAPHEGL